MTLEISGGGHPLLSALMELNFVGGSSQQTAEEQVEGTAHSCFALMTQIIANLVEQNRVLMQRLETIEAAHRTDAALHQAEVRALRMAVAARDITPRMRKITIGPFDIIASRHRSGVEWDVASEQEARSVSRPVNYYDPIFETTVAIVQNPVTHMTCLSVAQPGRDVFFLPPARSIRIFPDVPNRLKIFLKGLI